MANNEPFGFDPEDLDRVLRGTGEQLRGAFRQFGKLIDGSGDGAGWSTFSDSSRRQRRPAPDAKTAGETGDGVWTIYTVGGDGGARIEQVFATELDALRANKHNTDSNRRVRFLPYGIGVSVLDTPEDS